MAGNRVEIVVQPGTNPTPDATELETLHYTATDGVYFNDGKLWSLPGYISAEFSNGQVLRGAARTIVSYRSTINHYLVGTHSRFYTYENGALYNITPLLTATTAIANSIDTDYVTLANNPIATVITSKTVTITSAAHKLVAADSVTISGVSGNVGGIPDAEINTTHIVRSVTTNTYTITVATTAATSTASGGGASVISRTAILRVTAASHGMANGDRVLIASAATMGGIADTQINAQHIIRNIAAGTFDIVVTTKATSAVTAGGGASTTYSKQIVAGEINFSAGFGYGGGLYGVGLYGVGKTFTSVFKYPRIWSGGVYGDDFIGTAGGQTGVYIWENATATAPTALTNAPTAVNWVFIAGNIVVTLGQGGVGNRIKASDAGDATIWSASAASYAYSDDIEGAGTFISQASSKGINLLYTENEVYTFEFKDKPDIWETRLLFSSDGLIAPNARIELEEGVAWMGQGDFRIYDGASVSSIPNNTCRDYIYENLNYEATWKSFCRHDPVRKQVFFYFPLGAATEPDSYMIWNYKEGHCTLGTEDMTAAEQNVLQIQSPYTAYSISTSVDGSIYRRDIGDNADGAALTSYAETNYAMIGNGDFTMEITEITPDSTQTGSIDMTIYTKEYAQSTEEQTYSLDAITTTTEFMDTRAAGRQRKYRIEKNAVGERFSIGKWFETIIQRTRR